MVRRHRPDAAPQRRLPEPSADAPPQLTPFLAFTDDPPRTPASGDGRRPASRPKTRPGLPAASVPASARSDAAGTARRRYASSAPRPVSPSVLVPLAPSVPPTPESRAEGIPARSEAVARAITAFFDPRGILSLQAPRNWALATCRVLPFHVSQTSDNVHASLNKRRQELNARGTLARAQRKVDAELQASLARFGKTHEVDAQKARYLKLLFDPLMSLSDEILEELADELHADEHNGCLSVDGNGGNSPRRSPWKTEAQKGASRHSLAAVSATEGSSSRRRPATGEGKERVVRASGNNFSAGQVLLKGGDRQLLQAVHMRYASRVAENGRSEQMRRSTWFRFLHHGGLLGPDGAVFSKAAKAFDLFADHEAELREWEVPSNVEPSLNFASWTGAVQYVLLHASGRRGTEAEIIKHFWDVSLKQCQSRLSMTEGGGSAPPRASPPLPPPRPLTRPPVVEHLPQPTPQPVVREPPDCPDAESKAGSPTPRLRFDSNSRGSSAASLQPQPPAGPAPPRLRPGLGAPARQGGLLGWQATLAEERMCEPEVLELMQVFQQPLRRLFVHYATRSSETAVPCTPETGAEQTMRPRSDSVSSGPSIWSELCGHEAQGFAKQESGPSGGGETPSLAQFEKAERLMSPVSFQALLQDLRLYPEIVQIHTLRQHLQISLARDGLPELRYEAFAECLLRIAFVYLQVYGNDIQQEAPSKWMCLWLICLLSARCHTFGADLGLPLQLAVSGTFSERPVETEGEEDDSFKLGRLWNREPCDLDSLPLKRLTLYRTLDADMSSSPDARTPLVATPIPLSSRPATVCSVAFMGLEG